MKKQKYFILLAVIFFFCLKGQTVYAEETPLQVEDNWLTREVARQVRKSDIKTLTQEDFEKVKLINFGDIHKQNIIDNIPKEIALLKNLTELKLQYQSVSEISTELCTLKNLTRIYLFSNNITKLPKEITKLNLTVLDLGSNKLNGIPPEIFSLTSLKTLKLSNINIEDIPKDLLNLTNLNDLSLSENKIRDFKILCQLKKIVSLELDHNYIETIPIEIQNLSELKYLTLSSNKINKLPNALFEVPKLNLLLLDNNKLTELPENIYLLKNLGGLRVDNNLITSIPTQINDLDNLYYLSLSHNNIKHIPNVGNLVNLTTLDMDYNELTELPKGIENLSIIGLSFKYNQIRNIPYLITTHLIEGTNQTITLPTKKVALNSNLIINNIISASNGAITLTPNNNGLYNKNNNHITWKIITDTDNELSYNFTLDSNNSNLKYSGTVIQPVQIVDESELADNKIYFTDDYKDKTVTKDETIRIPVKLSTIKDYYALDSSIKYDKTKLEFLGYSNQRKL